MRKESVSREELEEDKEREKKKEDRQGKGAWGDILRPRIHLTILSYNFFMSCKGHFQDLQFHEPGGSVSPVL